MHDTTKLFLLENIVVFYKVQIYNKYIHRYIMCCCFCIIVQSPDFRNIGDVMNQRVLIFEINLFESLNYSFYFINCNIYVPTYNIHIQNMFKKNRINLSNFCKLAKKILIIKHKNRKIKKIKHYFVFEFYIFFFQKYGLNKHLIIHMQKFM